MLKDKIKQIQEKNQVIDAFNAFFNDHGFTRIEPELITRTTSFIVSNLSVSEDKLTNSSLSIMLL